MTTATNCLVFLLVCLSNHSAGVLQFPNPLPSCRTRFQLAGRCFFQTQASLWQCICLSILGSKKERSGLLPAPPPIKLQVPLRLILLPDSLLIARGALLAGRRQHFAASLSLGFPMFPPSRPPWVIILYCLPFGAENHKHKETKSKKITRPMPHTPPPPSGRGFYSFPLLGSTQIHDTTNEQLDYIRTPTETMLPLAASLSLALASFAPPSSRSSLGDMLVCVFVYLGNLFFCWLSRGFVWCPKSVKTQKPLERPKSKSAKQRDLVEGMGRTI